MIVLILRVISCSIISLLIYQYGFNFLDEEVAQYRLPLTILISAPLWTSACARYLIAILPAIRDAGRRSAHASWSGRYYAFQNQQLRFYVVPDGVWIDADDLGKILVPTLQDRELRLLGEQYVRLKGTMRHVIGESGLMRLVKWRTEGRFASPEMIKFRNWLVTEALPNVRRLPQSSAQDVEIPNSEVE